MSNSSLFLRGEFIKRKIAASTVLVVVGTLYLLNPLATGAAPNNPSQPASEFERFSRNPFAWFRQRVAKKKEEEEKARKAREAEEQRHRELFQVLIEEERIAAEPGKVIEEQGKAIRQLNEQLSAEKKAVADAQSQREAEAKSAGDKIGELKKKLEDLTKQIETQTKALEEREKALKKKDEEFQKKLDESREERKSLLARQEREINLLKEKMLGDYESATFDGVEFVKIPAGTFEMGSSDAQAEELKNRGAWSKANEAEQPRHKVQITKALLIGRTEVTQKQWKETMGKNPSAFKGDDLPVESVSWDDVAAFLIKLDGRTRGKYRLPTEAEWEYCCRAGGEGLFGKGENDEEIGFEKLDKFGWTSEKSENKTHPVGAKTPNAWGLRDMNGNVWEWCQDWFEPDFYAASPPVDPLCGEKGTERVFRGGAWAIDPAFARAASRGANLPSYKSQYVGFRVVREIESVKETRGNTASFAP